MELAKPKEEIVVLKNFLAGLKNIFLIPNAAQRRQAFEEAYLEFCQEKYEYEDKSLKEVTTFQEQDERTWSLFNNLEEEVKEEDEGYYEDLCYSFDGTEDPADLLKSDFSDYRSSGPLGAIWPNRTLCIVVGKRLHLVRNERPVHAEEKAMEYLKMEKNATLYINWSPCGACCKRFMDWHKIYKDHKVTIIFAGLYCLSQGDNRAQLAKLKATPNFMLRPFTNSDWTDLFEYLAMIYGPNGQLEDTQADQKDAEKTLGQLKLDE